MVLLVCIVALIPLGGVFTALDAAIMSISPARLDELVKDERPGAARLQRVVAVRPRYINLLVLLRIVCEIAATVMLAAVLIDAMSQLWALVTAAAVMVVLSYVVIGAGPRTLGRQHAYSIALASSLPLQWLGTLLHPISRLLIVLGNAITPGGGFRQGPFATEIELRELVDMAQERGVVADEERRMIQSVFDLGDTPAREVMVPRTDMVWIERFKSAGQATSLAVRSGHSRIPVIGDSADDVLGVVYLKDLVTRTYYSVDGGRSVTVGELMRPAVFAPDSKRLDGLLDDMQRSRNHMTMLVDEYGGISGLVTIEDVLEEIVGEIADEYDQAETPPVAELDDGRFRVSARLPLDDLGELFGVDLEDPEVDTAGGLLAHALGRVPLPGSTVRTGGLILTGEGGTNPRGRIRISTVLAARDPDSVPAEHVGGDHQKDGGHGRPESEDMTEGPGDGR
ncbi:HlyC/CorC family transporter [Tomitella fengzijianii]|uniref:HlyC/CorC family transporter n=1 Tax=Tomitella fengzijianii TaxID=2597660 RepID=A0A516X8C8_9ACTN|nr:HlyC/CorC family transporter [Tomitella fengzijianii]